MEKRTREILALVLLVFLGIGIACGMGWYILVGHNWNVTATHIDDYVGEMEGYTVVLFEGTLQPEHVGDIGTAILEEKPNAGAGESSSAASQKGVSQESASSGDVSQGSASQEAASPESASQDEPEPHEPISAADAAVSYKDKDASVITLDIANARRYTEPMILKCGDKRIGVFSIGGNMEYPRLFMNVAYLRLHGVDTVLVISTDRRLAKLSFSGVDTIVYACDADISSGGEHHHGAFCVQSPLVGEVGAIIVSPSNVVTSKTVTEL